LRFIVSLSLTGKNRGTPHDAQEETSTRKPKQSPAQEAGSRMDDGVAAASCEGVGRSTAVGSAVAALMLIFLKKNPSFGVEEMETWKCFMQSESQKLLITKRQMFFMWFKSISHCFSWISQQTKVKFHSLPKKPPKLTIFSNTLVLITSPQLPRKRSSVRFVDNLCFIGGLGSAKLSRQIIERRPLRRSTSSSE
jgi:hypothetical protein